jgi:arylsulfatase A-like enzyme
MRYQLAFALFLGLMVAARAQQPQANVIIILADDLGWSDLGCYGSEFHETPFLDSFSQSAVRFTHAYAPAPVCTPTRAALLTGKSPARLGITIWSEGSLKGPTDRKLLQANSKHDLPLSEKTLAEYFREHGYLTAMIGKWHLGSTSNGPEAQGFDINIGGTHWGAPTTFFWPYKGVRTSGNEFRYVPDLPYGQDGEYLTDRLTDESLAVIDQAHRRRQPFFLYLAHHAPHTPIEAKTDDIAYFRKRLTDDSKHQRNPVYAGMLKSLDESVGRILQHLEELKIEQETIVIFTSDNGGFIGQVKLDGVDVLITSNSPLRSGKGTCYEGGLRVPLLVRWPKLSRAGVTDQPVVLTDLFPTFMHSVLQQEPEQSDGVDLTPLLKAPDATLPDRVFYFHYPHYYHVPVSTPVSAIRKGDWKLLHYYEDDRDELYNLSADPYEKLDLASHEPSLTAQLGTQLKDWLDEVGAEMPKFNDPQR